MKKMSIRVQLKSGKIVLINSWVQKFKGIYVAGAFGWVKVGVFSESGLIFE